MQHLKQKLDEALKNFTSQNNGTPAELYEPINYSLSLGGKRLRPMLVLLACDAFGGNVDLSVNAALGIEVFHNFTLLHDDIMDNAPLRRNMPTVHQKWNSNIAILSGDTMFVQSYQLMAQTKHSKVLSLIEIFSKTAIEVCEGQQLDMNFETTAIVSIDDYIKMIELKTAVLLACALKVGSIIANATDADAENMYEFGRNIGIAFQLQDDILDVFGAQENFGKMVGGDIASNKKTFLLLKSMELANAQQLEELKHCLESKYEVMNDKIEAVKNIYSQLNIREHAENKMREFYNIGIECLQNVNVAIEKKAMLKKFADDLMVREN